MWSGRYGYHCLETTSEHTAVLCNQGPGNPDPRSVRSIFSQLQPNISHKHYYYYSPLSPQYTVTYSIFALMSFPSAWCDNFCYLYHGVSPHWSGFLGDPDHPVIRTTLPPYCPDNRETAVFIFFWDTGGENINYVYIRKRDFIIHFESIFIFLRRKWTQITGIQKFKEFFQIFVKPKVSLLSLLLHRTSCRFTNYHTTNKCTNCMSFILNHFLKHFSLLLHVSIAYRLSSSGSTYSS